MKKINFARKKLTLKDLTVNVYEIESKVSLLEDRINQIFTAISALNNSIQTMDMKYLMEIKGMKEYIIDKLDKKALKRLNKINPLKAEE